MLVTKTKSQKKYYETLFSNFNNYIEIRLIDNKGNATAKYLTYDELLEYETPNNTNVYIGMYERRYKGNGKISNCTKTNVIWLDFDDMELMEIMFRIDTSNIPEPSMIVASGNGYHVYWKLNKPAFHELKPIIDELAKRLNADTGATDTARVMRVPDTMNVKAEPLKCELLQVNDNTADLKRFESLLGVKASIRETNAGSGVITELATIKFNGLHNMANGVSKGQRNFCTGRIVQTLKRLNYTKQEATDIVFRWNSLNKPKKEPKELRKDINTYWHDERYKFDGKDFSHERLQEINEVFIDDETLFFKGVGESTHSYDNELLNPDVFHKINGLTFAILSIIKLEGDEGIRREHLADLSRRNPQDKTLRQSLNLLEKMDYIKVAKKKRTNFYIFNEKANYNRGYTLVGKSLHRSYIHGELNEPEYKLLILIESYAYDHKKEVFPSNQTLALRTGQSNSTIQRNLRQLRHKQFIKTEIKEGKRFIQIIYR